MINTVSHQHSPVEHDEVVSMLLAHVLVHFSFGEGAHVARVSQTGCNDERNETSSAQLTQIEAHGIFM